MRRVIASAATLTARAPARRKGSGILIAWALLGLVACALLPWYFPQNLTLGRALQGVFGGADTASALVQALHHGRPWLGFVLAGLGLARFVPLLQEQAVDMAALLLMTEQHLRELGLPLGAVVKIRAALVAGNGGGGGGGS